MLEYRFKMFVMNEIKAQEIQLLYKHQPPLKLNIKLKTIKILITFPYTKTHKTSFQQINTPSHKTINPFQV